ncbi:aldose epimerase family protein [Clostridium sp.]|uniref:aldose epimerase family protein n=1 Tax=Clostridium sp. TaxID=1506 RepID=UPI003F2D1719
MNIESKIIGEFHNKEIISYSLENSNGLKINVLNYGGIITDIIVPDKDGKLENVVMKYNDMNTYKENPSYYGALIGRTSGRVCEGTVELNGKTLTFNKNYGLHQGHGGDIGFDKKVMDVKTFRGTDEAYVELSYLSTDNEEGYPGNFDLTVRYTLTENNELKINYKGISDETTLVNLTNHSYFNLSGSYNDSILNHHLYIDSDFLVQLDSTQVPTGKILNINGSAFDFTTPKTIGRDIEEDDEQLKVGCGYDHPWILNGGDQIKLKLYHKPSGRVMDVYTTQKAVVLYSQNFPDEELLEGGKKCERRHSIAIETQSPPIGRGNAFINHSVLEMGEEYNQETIYKFSIR